MGHHNKTQPVSDQRIFFLIFAAAVVATLIFLLWPRSVASHQLSPRAEFAACLSSKGVVVYGTDTCPSCQLQKGMFEDDFSRIHSINCDFHQEECTQNGIQGTPTWMYNGQRLQGVQTFQDLAQFSGCKAP